MQISIKTILRTNIETAWQNVILPQTLVFIAKPILSFTPILPTFFPKHWEIGTYKTKLKVFGFLPFGSHSIVIEKPDSKSNDVKILIDNGYGQLISRWYHAITIQKITDDTCQYEDRVEIEAGILTPFIWLFALVFYQWRQFRWKKLIHNNFNNL